MQQRLNTVDTLAMGFMAFAFFFGAGNLIFPPLAGHLAGVEFVPAMFGFLATGVGLPLISLLIAAKVGGGLPRMAPYLPVTVVTVLAVALYLVIGPAFAVPRTALVAYEMGAKPILGLDGPVHLALYTAGFFTLVFVLGLNRGELIDRVGKYLTPVLLVLLLALAAAVMVAPVAKPGLVTDGYADQSFIKGFLEGYNTMDSLGGIMFGMLFIQLLRQRGVTDRKAQFANLSKVALIAATGLAVVYGSLFYLGATAGDLAAGVENGGTIIVNYVQHLFGPMGVFMLAMLVVLACVTTAVGLLSAIADFFTQRFPVMSYRNWLAVLAIASAVVANVGLTQLLALTIPVLFIIYPVAIAIMALALLKDRLPAPRKGYALVVSVAFVFGLLDAANVSGLEVLKPVVNMAKILPLYNYSLAWVLPTVAALLVALFAMGHSADIENELEEEVEAA